jgi:transcriptional regulator with XRE-family HTH domain
MITGDQVKEARRLLGWSQGILAVNAHISQASVAHFETGKRAQADWISINLLDALEYAGIEFSADSRGVRIRKLTENA